MHYATPFVLSVLLSLGSVAHAQFRRPAPLPAALTVMARLADEATALTYEAQTFILDDDDYEEVEDELRDVARDMEKVLKLLSESQYRPSKWNRVHRRVEDLEEEIDELAEEIGKALRRQNLQRNRQRFHLNHHARLHGPASRVLVVDEYGVVRHAPSAAPAYSPGWELRARVESMQRLVRELCDLSHMR